MILSYLRNMKREKCKKIEKLVFICSFLDVYCIFNFEELTGRRKNVSVV